jgi:hypothetical protein
MSRMVHAMRLRPVAPQTTTACLNRRSGSPPTRSGIRQVSLCIRRRTILRIRCRTFDDGVTIIGRPNHHRGIPVSLRTVSSDTLLLMLIVLLIPRPMILAQSATGCTVKQHAVDVARARAKQGQKASRP